MYGGTRRNVSFTMVDKHGENGTEMWKNRKKKKRKKKKKMKRKRKEEKK